MNIMIMILWHMLDLETPRYSLFYGSRFSPARFGTLSRSQLVSDVDNLERSMLELYVRFSGYRRRGNTMI